MRGARQMSTLVSRGVTVQGTVTKAEQVKKSRAQRVSELGSTLAGHRGQRDIGFSTWTVKAATGWRACAR